MGWCNEQRILISDPRMCSIEVTDRKPFIVEGWAGVVGWGGGFLFCHIKSSSTSTPSLPFFPITQKVLRRRGSRPRSSDVLHLIGRLTTDGTQLPLNTTDTQLTNETHPWLGSFTRCVYPRKEFCRETAVIVTKVRWLLLWLSIPTSSVIYQTLGGFDSRGYDTITIIQVVTVRDSEFFSDTINLRPL